MRITPEQAAQAVTRWIVQADPDEVAAVFQSTFGVVSEAKITDSGEEIIVDPVAGFSDEDLVKEMEMYFVFPFPIPDVFEWPESLTDEILKDFGIGIETLKDATDPVGMVISAGMDLDTIIDRIETDRIRTDKRCGE